MKKLFLMAAVAVMTAVGANAQGFEKGDWYFGAQSTDLSLNHSFGDGTLPYTSFDLQGFGGRFLTDRFAVDALLGTSFLKIKGTDATIQFVFGAGARYYPVGDLFARVGYKGMVPSEGEVASLVDIQVGYDLFIAKNVYFEPAVYYSTRLDTKVSSLGLAVGIGVKF